MKNKLWCDLKTDKERVEFLRSGRAHETGIIAKAIVEDVAQAFERHPNKVDPVDFKTKFRKFIDKQIKEVPGWYR